MKNKFKIGEIVYVDGEGKLYEKRCKGLGIVEMKEYNYTDYLVTILSECKEEWFKEKDIHFVMRDALKRHHKYKVVLAINMEGLKQILEKIEKKTNKNNNIMNKMSIYKEYKRYGKKYAILAWTSTYWSENNFVVKCIEDTLKKLRSQNIAYKQIIIGETDPTFIKINEFIDNDTNVDIFKIFQKIEIDKIGGILV